ncbi:MAG: hypothetical protein QM757_29005 [Paludibaculum sp.]
MLQHAPKWPQPVLTQVAPEFVFYEAVYKEDPEAAKPWLEHCKDSKVSDYWRARAAVHGASGDLEQGRDDWYKGWSLVLQAPPRGCRLLDEHDFRLMAERWWPDLVSLVPVRRNTAMEVVTAEHVAAI